MKPSNHPDLALIHIQSYSHSLSWILTAGTTLPIPHISSESYYTVSAFKSDKFSQLSMVKSLDVPKFHRPHLRSPSSLSVRTHRWPCALRTAHSHRPCEEWPCRRVDKRSRAGPAGRFKAINLCGDGPWNPNKLPSGNLLLICYIAIENGLFIVDLPNLKMVIFHSYVSLPEGKIWKWWFLGWFIIGCTTLLVLPMKKFGFILQ